jgi:signal peptidase I
MRSVTNYLLSIIDHKSTYDLAGVTIEMQKQYENNLRERNPQMGRVEAVPNDNPLHLNVGDVVVVNHFTFYGDIGEDKSFIVKPHLLYEGIRVFRAEERQIFFRMNGDLIECMPDYIICDYRVEPEEHFGVYFGEKKWIECTHGKYAGKEVVTLKNSMYLITIGKTDYYKVRTDEVVWCDGVVGDYLLVRLLPEKEHEIFTIKSNNQTAIAMTGCGQVMAGDVIQIYRNQGIETPDGYAIHIESVVGVWNDAEQFKDYGKEVIGTKVN